MTTEEISVPVSENKRDKVFCSFTKLVPISEIKEHPKNPNHHDREQIEILANVIKATGWRTPIGVSTRSGFIIRGHGRFAAAKALGLTQVPVDFQNYETESQELADLLADNKIADLGQIDFQGVSSILKDIPPDQQLFSGFRDFEIAPLLLAEWVKPALAEMPESIFSYKFSVNEVENAALRTAIKIIQSKNAATLTDGQCLEILANHYLGKTIKDEQVESSTKKLSEDVPKKSSTVTTSQKDTTVTTTQLIDTVGAPRTFRIERVTSTLWGDIDAHVIVSTDGGRYYTDDNAIIALARGAQEKKAEVKIKVDQKGKDLWVTSLELTAVEVEGKTNA